MSVGHLDRPNEDTKYKATMRACQPQEERRDPTSKTTYVEQEVIIPESFREAIFEAFNNDRYVLAELSEGCIVSLVTLSEANYFDVEDYKKKHKQPIIAIDGSL
jgi:hypothetical protein